MHDGIVWPLYLKPVHRNLSPVWKLEFPPSGDRIGECFSGSHSLEEMLELCGRMSATWQEGLDYLLELKPLYAGDPARRLDITVAEAVGIQFRSGYNTLRFYDLRESLLYGPAESRAEILEQLREIVEEEIENSKTMAALCETNPFLGFQAEAEGYTYSPGELRWRVERLRDLLRTEFEEAATAIAAGEQVFPMESGLAEGPFNHAAVRVSESFASNWQNDDAWKTVPRAAGASEDPAWSWQAAHDDTFLYLNVECAPSKLWRAVAVAVSVEATHIYPRRTFRADVHGKRPIRQGWLAPDAPWEFAAPETGGRQAFRLRIPFDAFQGEADPSRPMRINIQVTHLTHDKEKQIVRSWAPASGHPVQSRLGYGGDNPSEMGWLRLE